MFPETVEQNRELLYKFPLRDDDRHGGTSLALVVTVAFRPNPIMEGHVLNGVTTAKIRAKFARSDKTGQIM